MVRLEGIQNEKEKNKDRHICFLGSIHGIAVVNGYGDCVSQRRNNSFWLCNKHHYCNGVCPDVPAGVHQQ